MKYTKNITNLLVLAGTLVIIALFSITTSYAEKKNEFREDASNVVVGEVTKVFKSEGEEYVTYVVRIRVEAREKGTGPNKEEHFYAECFQRKPHKGPGMAMPGASGHRGIPEVGERVRVFTIEENAINTGVYPSWYDVLPQVEPK